MSSRESYTSPTPEVQSEFPRLHDLVRQARVTEVSAGSTTHFLLGWTMRDGTTCGWLCVPPDARQSNRMCLPHALLQHWFGGIVERWNDRDSWLLNLNDALTAALAMDGSWMKCLLPEGARLPSGDWYPIAIEANGNLTLCNRTTGELLMYAHDHACDHIEPLEGYPEYTFYRIREARVFSEWVEQVAAQWLEYVR